jgi:glycosyltransferase involved in cell wall biosynthesis
VKNSAGGKPTLRVLQVFGVLGVGGAETWLLSLLKYFRENERSLPFKVQTSVCLTNGEPGQLDAEARALGAKLYHIRYGRDELIPFARRFRKLLKENRFHAIHDHQDYAVGNHLLLGLGHLPPVRIAHVHNPPDQFIDRRNRWNRLGKVIGRYSLDHSGAQIAGTSERLLREYGFETGAGNGAPKAVYCGFDVRAYAGDRSAVRHAVRAEFGWPDDAKIVLFVGRLGGDEILMGGLSHKNPRFAFDVFEEAMKHRPDLRMLFVGEKGKMHSVLAGFVKERAQGDTIRFLGLRRDIPRLMLAADLLLFPSTAEGLGMVAVEAQAAGLPVLASDRVPTECVVVPSLVRFRPLEAPLETWARDALDLIDGPKPPLEEANAAVASSPFSIATSASQLLQMYSRGLGRE